MPPFRWSAWLTHTDSWRAVSTSARLFCRCHEENRQAFASHAAAAGRDRSVRGVADGTQIKGAGRRSAAERAGSGCKEGALRRGCQTLARGAGGFELFELFDLHRDGGHVGKLRAIQRQTGQGGGMVQSMEWTLTS